MPEFDDVFNDIGEKDQAFKVLFFQYYPECLSFALMCLEDQLAARNVTLEAFFLLWERHIDFDKEKTIKAFLYLAVRNKCLHYLPSRARTHLPSVIPPSSLPQDILNDIFDHVDTPGYTE